MPWNKLSSTTLTTTGDSIDSGTITASTFNTIIGHVISSSTDINRLSRFNGDTGNNYQNRYSSNGGADATSTSGPTMFTNSTGAQYNEFGVAFFADLSGEEKMLISHAVGDSASTGAGTAPDRRDTISKWTGTDDVTVVNGLNSDVGDYIADSNVMIMGNEIPVAALAKNLQDNSLFVEKDTARRYWGTDKVTTEEVYAYTTTQSTQEKLSGTAQAYSSERAGVELVSSIFAGKYIKTGKWNLKRVGTLGSNAFMKVEDSSGTVKGTSTGVAASGISNSAYEDVTFTLPKAVELANGDRVYIQYTGADGSGNYLALGEKHPSTTPTGWEFTIYNKRDGSGGNPSGGWGDDGLPTALVPVATFDSAPASNVISDITWTMQLTYEDDFSSDSGYTFTSGNSISGGRLTAKPAGSLGFTKPLGFTLDNTFVVRIHGWEVQSGYSWSSSMSHIFGFSNTATNTAYNGSGNAWGFKIFNRNSGGMINNIWTKLNGSLSSGGNSTVGEGGTDLVAGTKYYIEMKKTGDGSAELRIYSDSNFTTLHTAAWISDTAMSNPTGLDHFALQGQTVGGTHIAKLDKIEIWNGVTSIN